MKSSFEKELNESKDTIEILGGKVNNIEEIILPVEESKRTILVIEHVKKTDVTYPRNYDKILKKPLKK